jgi:DNA-binding transcriptional MerR regulator
MREQVQVATTRADVEGVIPDKMYFRIGEVAAIVGVKPYVLRYWESEFAALRPQKSRTRQRMYRRRDVELLLKIKHLLYDRKYTIAGARQLLKRGIALGVEIPAETSAELQAGAGAPPRVAEAVASGEDARAVTGWAPVAPAAPVSPAPVEMAAVAAAAPTVAVGDEGREPAPVATSQLTLDLRVPDMVREDLCRGLRELLALCDADEAADPDPAIRGHRAGDDGAVAQETASDPG